MPTFEEALSTNVRGMSQRFKQANSDLHTEVVQASNAVQNVSNGDCELSLFPLQQQVTGQAFRLVISTRAKDRAETVATFFVPGHGYPIQANRDDVSSSFGAKLEDRVAVEAFFTEMATNPESKLGLFGDSCG